MRATITALTVAGMLLPHAAHALNEPVWLVVNAGGSHYSMNDLNREIEAYDSTQPADGMVYPKISRGMAWGLTAGYETPMKWNFGLGIDRMYASSDAHDASGAMKYDFTANGWRLFGQRATGPLGTNSLHFGGGVGIVAESGKLVVSQTGQAPVELKIGGKGALYELFGGGDFWFAPQMAVTGSVGYRYAKIKSVDIGGAPLIMASDGQAVSVDYSGPYLRLGVRLMGKSIGE
jgi:hypothetical protein